MNPFARFTSPHLSFTLAWPLSVSVLFATVSFVSGRSAKPFGASNAIADDVTTHTKAYERITEMAHPCAAANRSGPLRLLLPAEHAAQQSRRPFAVAELWALGKAAWPNI